MLIIRMTIIFNWFVRKPTESNEKKMVCINFFSLYCNSCRHESLAFCISWQ